MNVTESPQKVHFKGLDTLRAIAAIVVVVSHIELIKSRNGIPALNIHYLKLPDDHLAVILFFILSGFLITYLLMKEKEDNGSISFKNFYLRRIFRIWPVYYLVIILSFILFNPKYTFKTIALCLGVFPNIASALNIEWDVSPQIWSIGVEEQFYLFWPLLIYIIPKNKLLTCLLVFFIAYTILPHAIRFTNGFTFKSEELNMFTDKFFPQSKFNCMSLGGIFGYLYALKRKELGFFYKGIIAYPSIILSFALWFTAFKIANFNDVLYSILFGIMILNVATNKNLKINLDFKPLNFLGKISYGIYMYHWIIILLVIKFIPTNLIANHLTYNIILYLTVLGLSIFVAFISFKTIERYFLGLKNKYQTKYK